MFKGMHEIDWSRLRHAYGTAEEVPELLRALGSADEEERGEALRRYYSAVHHQGDITACTTATLPFLFELAADAGRPGRASVIELLVDIGTVAVERADPAGEDWEYGGHNGAATYLRGRAEDFIRFAADDDRLVRQAAIPALGLLVDDPERAARLLRERLPAETGTVERQLVAEAMATLALRLPAAAPAATAWLGALADDRALDPTTRLAALVHRARCAQELIGEEILPAALALLGEPVEPDPDWWRTATPAHQTPDPEPGSAPPYVLAAFLELDRHGQIHAPTTKLLRTFHQVLGFRAPERSALLLQQLRSADPGARLDALRMTTDLVNSTRGDYGSLIAVVAEQLDDPHPEVSAEAAHALHRCHPVAEPARAALAGYVTAHGPRAWASRHPELRRAHQEAVLALAELGDERAVPSLRFALEDGTDVWRAYPALGLLPRAAGQLLPGLAARIRGLRPSPPGEWSELEVALSALGRLDPAAALPAVRGKLESAARAAEWTAVTSALQTLQRFGPVAAPALPTIRELAAHCPEGKVALAALAALRAVGGEAEDALPRLLDLLHDNEAPSDDVADVLAEFGPAAAAALPRLRELLTHSYDWTRVHGAAAIWAIGGEPEAETVLPVLLTAWEGNSVTGRLVVPALQRMGPAAAPAVPVLLAQLARPERGGFFASLAEDEALQRRCRALLAELA
ncbi:HEAT repeat domain-containing protein [Kitasatospora sp. NPDC058162]|uniref:HEAT repeat domain-containing protein n=1 Tax=Kitasatospora sp. NPDC058162 TaxID=3346362 RepID=UPI0036DC00B5